MQYAVVAAWMLLLMTTLVLHGIWEYAHMSLYSNYEWMVLWNGICVFAVLGDIAYTLLVVSALSAYKQSKSWLLSPRYYDYVVLSCIGFFLAVAIEYKALAFGEWTYGPHMPIIPFLLIGLSPVLQMMILLPLCVWLTYIGMRLVRNVG